MKFLSRCGVDRCIREEHFKCEPFTAAAWRARSSAKGFPPTIPATTVREAVRLYLDGLTAREVAGRLGISQGSVQLYVNGMMRSKDSGMGYRPWGYWKRRRQARGEQLPWHKLSKAQVKSVVTRAAAGESAPAIAQDLGVTPCTIHEILLGRTWAWLTGIQPRPKQRAKGARNGRAVLNETLVRDIVRRGHAGESPSAIARALGQKPNTIRDVLSGKSWAWLTGIGRSDSGDPAAPDTPHPAEALVRRYWPGGQSA